MAFFSKLAKKWMPARAKESIERLADFDYADGQKIERIAFICGLHRSGTTLVERLLSARFQVSCLRASVPESEGQHIQKVYSPASLHGGPGKFAFSRSAYEELQALTNYPAHREKIMEDWRRFVIGESPVLLEKSPPNLTKIGWLRKVFPESRFVIVTRDPRAVSSATQKWSRTSLPELMMHWNAAYSQALEDFEESDCALLRYEDLVEDDAGEMSRIARFLKLEPRQSFNKIEERHGALINSNAKYIGQHAGAMYGSAVWEKFGYKF